MISVKILEWFNGLYFKIFYRIEILQNYKIYIQIIKIMLHFLYNFWTLEKWYRLSGRSVSSMDMSVLVHVCPNDKLFFVSVRLNIEHSMKLIGRTSNQLLKITNKSINISEIFIEKTFLTDFYRFWAWIFRLKNAYLLPGVFSMIFLS